MTPKIGPANFWEGVADEAFFSEKKGVFSEKGGGNSVNERFGKDLHRKSNSVKRSGPFSEPLDSENRKVAVLNPFSKISSHVRPPPPKPRDPLPLEFFMRWIALGKMTPA